MTLYGGIEAGGTKFVCVVASGPEDIRGETRFPTTTPQETIGKAIEFFRPFLPLAGIGIGTFGPVDLDPASPTFGYITTTPKPYWANADIAGSVQRGLGVPVKIDTDVNAAALGEFRWGAAQGCDPVLYITIGTGIGGGGILHGKPMHGLVHPEMGHMRLPHDLKADPFPGACPYHGDCFEGLAAGPALKARWGRPAENLPADHPAWVLEAHYVALAVANLVVVLSPRRVVLGGGVMEHPGLVQQVRGQVLALLNSYVQSPTILEHIDDYIVLPGLRNRAGVLGSVALAMEA
jgi:fructokinase